MYTCTTRNLYFHNFSGSFPFHIIFHVAAAPGLGAVPPSEDAFFSTPAALLYTAQLVELIADVLDQPLPYPITRRDAIRYM